MIVKKAEKNKKKFKKLVWKW